MINQRITEINDQMIVSINDVKQSIAEGNNSLSRIKSNLDKLHNMEKEVSELRNENDRMRNLIESSSRKVISHTNFLETRLSTKIMKQEDSINGKVNQNQENMQLYSTQITGITSDIETLRNQITVLRNAVIGSAVAVGIVLIIAIIVMFKLRSK